MQVAGIINLWDLSKIASVSDLIKCSKNNLIGENLAVKIIRKEQINKEIRGRGRGIAKSI